VNKLIKSKKYIHQNLLLINRLFCVSINEQTRPLLAIFDCFTLTLSIPRPMSRFAGGRRCRASLETQRNTDRLQTN